jgi:TolB-like protein/Flp pilus assembly protein TadD/predicted Ser/Thr protein kinase
MDNLLEQTISHYRLISLLGAGGMGMVYRGHDARLGRDVALKVLSYDMMADETARARFIAEARTASSLNHPHIAHVYDVGEDRGHVFFAMELVEGRPLRELIQRGALPISTVCQYGAQIAGALAFAHERGVVHRDLKTANVMITPEGRAKVLDFGLAKRLQNARKDDTRDPGLTASGTILGTPNYLPPEVLLGGSADARSDIWALGVMLYEMASGKLPFDGASIAELAGAIVNESPNPLSARVPTGLQMVIARCLAKDPVSRYRSASEVEAALEAIDPSAIRRQASGGGSRRTWLITAGALAAVAFAVTLALHTGDIQKRIAGGNREGAGDHPHIGSLAVLPLANLSGDPSQEFFADGMTEELITSLAPIRSLKVISRTSVMRFKGSKKSLREIAGALDVDGIVEGSVLRAGDKVRITAQLIEAAKDRHLWAKSYEREVKDVLGLQSEVAQDIANEIQLQLSPQEAARMTQRKTVNPEAYELYLHGRFEWSKVSPDGVQKAIEYYQKALALDPTDARYSSGLADAYLLQTQVIGTMPQREGMAKVKEYARRALAADDASAEAHTSIAVAILFADWNWSEAERHVRHAIQLTPGYSTAHLVYSVLLATSGRLNEAIEQDSIATSLDPLSLIVNWNASASLFYARRYDEAIAQAKRAVELDPTSPLAEGSLARIYEAVGNYQASLDILDNYLPESMGGKAVVARLRQGYATGGVAGYWRTMLALHNEGGEASKGDAIHSAMIYAKLGDRERALAYVERAFAQHSGDMIFLNVEPAFDSIREDPRFHAIMRRVSPPGA